MSDALPGLLFAATVLLPLVLAAACLSARVRAQAPRLLVVAPLPALLAAVFAPGGTAAFFPQPFRLTLALDAPGALLLGGGALLWSCAGAFAAALLRSDRRVCEFSVWWLLALAGSLGVFVVADVASFYLMFTLASLSAYGLIVHEETPRARRAAALYVGLAVVGEACLLLAFVMLANLVAAGNPSIREAMAALPAAPSLGWIVGLIAVGAALKMGLVPLHVWLPLAHPVAPAPASAVLSGALVAAGVIALVRFLPFETGAVVSGTALAAVGIVTAFYGVAVGLFQSRAKVVLAYSTVSQMGLVAAIAGMGLSLADGTAPLAAAYYTLHHALAKGGLFLAVAVIAAAAARHRRLVLAVTAVLALSLAGLPFTSGALAKIIAKPALGDGALALAFTLAAIGSTLLMLHFLAILAREPAPAAETPRGLMLPWLVLCAASLVVPWALFPLVGGKGSADLVAPSALADAAWPLAFGALAYLAFSRWQSRPTLPEGDILAAAPLATPLLRRLGRAFDSTEATLARWPAGGPLIVTLALLLCAAMALAG